MRSVARAGLYIVLGLLLLLFLLFHLLFFSFLHGSSRCLLRFLLLHVLLLFGLFLRLLLKLLKFLFENLLVAFSNCQYVTEISFYVLSLIFDFFDLFEPFIDGSSKRKIGGEYISESIEDIKSTLSLSSLIHWLLKAGLQEDCKAFIDRGNYLVLVISVGNDFALLGHPRSKSVVVGALLLENLFI